MLSKRGRPTYVTPEAFEMIEKVRTRARSERRKFIENFLWIKNTKRQMQRLTFNHSQELMWNVLEESLEDNTKPTRAIILKGRQIGATTLTAALTFCEVYNNDNTDALVMAHLKDRTLKLFQMHHLFLKNLPSDLQLPLSRSSRMELVWEETNSGISLATAGTTSFGRGGTVPIVHASEGAYYPSLYETLGALEPSIPDEPTSLVIIESTASGVGNEFHSFWEASVKGDTDYMPIFIPWQKDPKHRRNFDNPKTRDAWVERFLDDELDARMKHYGLDVSQIYWYWWYRKTKLHGDDLLMQQEFPCDAEECFISSGSPVFPLRLMAGFRKRVREGRMYDPFEQWNTLNDLIAIGESKKVQRNRDPYLEVWNTPSTKRKYVVSADTAEGLDGGDYSCALVFDLQTKNIVACLHGHIEPFDFARMVAKLGISYNGAIIAPERNGIGTATLSKLQDMNYPYLYRQRVYDSDYGLVTASREGWDTNVTSRKLLITHGKEIYKTLADQDGLIPCDELLKEISKFVYSGVDMKARAGLGHYDDRVMAWLIGLIVCAQEQDMGTAGVMSGADEPIRFETPMSMDEMIRARMSPEYLMRGGGAGLIGMDDDDEYEEAI